MSFLSSFKKLFGLGRDGGRNPLENRDVIKDKDPSHVWDIIGELGDGAFGKVYKAQHRESGIYAALKQVEIKADDDLEDFLVEIDILTKCKHINVVGLHETYFFGGKLWMYIEFCGGGAVDSIMVDLEKPLNENQIRYVCHEMCQALVFIHRQHVIHRDLKAGNVLLTMDGEVKLADFGVSAISDKTLQKRDSFIGTPYWMAPEVILCETLKDTPYSYKADIWSLGITLIEFAQIEPPNHEMHPMRVLIKIQKAEPPSLDDKRKWSLQFREFLKLCLVKDPEQRPTAEELLKHPFISNPPNKKVILDLISESKAEVVETVEDLTEDEDFQEMKRHMHDDSSIDLERISQTSIDADKRESTPEKQGKEAEKPSISEKIEEERSVTPERPETPDSDSTKGKTTSPKKTPAPAPPPEERERTPTPEIGEKKSPSKEESSEKSEEGSVKSRESSESPRESPEKDERGSPIPMSSLDEAEEKVTQHEDIVEVATISPPPEFQEDIEDKLSDEGIGPSADEKSDTSSQNGSPSKITDVQIDITPTVSDIVDEIIDDVIMSKSTKPSVPAVVLETIDTVIEEQMNEEFIEGKNVEIEEKDTEVAKQDSAIDTNESEDADIVKGGEKEKMPKRQSSVSELISNLEKMKEDHERSERSVSPRGSISPKEGSVSPRQKSFDESIPEETPVVSVTTVVKKDKGVSDEQKSFDKEDEKLSRDNRELEIQSVKVKIADDDEAQPIESSNIDDIITINGQPVPHASTIVLNGHISKIKDSPRGELEKLRERSESPKVESKNRDYVPQTDIDTLETKITNSVEPLDISNPDDDSSDQRSDTGSINTVDSVEKDDGIKESPRNRHRGHMRPRGDRSNKSQYRTLTKTRTFVINGEVVTQTTQKVVLAGEEHKSREEHLMSSRVIFINMTVALLKAAINMSARGDKESGLVKQGGSVYEPGPDEDLTKEGVKPKFIEQDKMERKSVIVRPVGSSLRLRCRANGNPLPAVRWMKDGHDTILISDEGSDDDKKKWTLKLRDLQETDSGTYQCVVSNRHGVINFTYSVEVIGQMKTKPVLIGPHPLNETVTLGGYASFQCKVKSQVQPHIQWLKKLDKELEATVNSTNIIEVKGQKFVVLKTGEVYKDNEGFYVNKLVIKNVLGTDIGMYICLGANTMGYSFRSAFLTIVSDNSDTPMSNNPGLSLNPGLSSDPHQRTQELDSSSSSEEVGNGSLPLIIAIPACVAIVLVTLAIFILKKRKRCNNNSNARRNTRFNAVPTQERENFTPAVQYPHILPPKGPPNRSMDKASTKHSSDFYSDISSVSRCHHHPQQGHSNHQYGY